jgi:5-methylcytosine-specific restriction endonuclease McrA
MVIGNGGSGITVLGAGRILGYDIELVRVNGSSWEALANWENSTEPVSAQAKEQRAAVEALVAKIYKLRCAAVMKRAKYRCEECDSLCVSGGQVHHKVFRSHGRDDRMENLEFLDPACHDRKHGIKVGA